MNLLRKIITRTLFLLVLIGIIFEIDPDTIDAKAKNKMLTMNNIYETQYKLTNSQEIFWNQILELYNKGVRKGIVTEIEMTVYEMQMIMYNPHILPECHYSDATSYLPGICPIYDKKKTKVTGQMVQMKKIAATLDNSKLNEKKIKRIINQLKLTKKTTEVNAVKKINKYISDTVKYDYKHKKNTLSAALSGNTVCSGYAYEFCAICKTVGLNAQYVVGIVKTNTGWQPHSWNKVKVNNVIKYVDVCWNDTGETLNYLLISKNRISVNRKNKSKTMYKYSKVKYF